ncbi:hypothetical protein [Streptomyces sp. 6-11-2]|uniref:hypothetical protein n=1 Tax=Streptomyces sp. 6-11-2 TaxID=2585753 RepID=UPI00116AF4E4|nr:hypothetical protein [Streptomyces sp. 6-11-2]GED89949.1 hypothetical protein TNCT6_70340 [Streptomyces sp. 6-11-2]
MSDHGPQQERFIDEAKAGPGSVMTEVGVITGELTVTTSLLPDGRVSIAVQYTDADEWYTLTGSLLPVPPKGRTPCTGAGAGPAGQRGGGAEAPSRP